DVKDMCPKKGSSLAYVCWMELRSHRMNALPLVDVFAWSGQDPLGSAQYSQKIPGVFHGSLLANLIVTGAVQLECPCRQRPFGLRNPLCNLAIVILKKCSLVDLFPVSMNRRFVHPGIHTDLVKPRCRSHLSRRSQNCEYSESCINSRIVRLPRFTMTVCRDGTVMKRKRNFLILLVIAASLWTGVAAADRNPATSAPDAAYLQSFEKWKAELVDDLKQNWLPLAGLFWLKPGQNSFGTDADNGFVFPKGPAHAGVFEL